MEKPIRIAQIMGKLWSGGVEMVVFNYYRAIDKSKIQFDFYYDADSRVNPPQELIDMGARFIMVPPYQDLCNYLMTLKKCFKDNKYRIVHSHINTLSVFPLYVAWKCGVPIRIAHNHSVPNGENFMRTGLKYVLKSASLIFPTHYFACSEKAGRWLFGNHNFNQGKVTVIKNAVDFDRFRISENEIASLKKEYCLEDKFVIGNVGRLTFAKNHRFLIKIFKKVSKYRSDAVLMLVGDGELNSQIRLWVDKIGLKDKVIFVGQVTNPEKYYRLIDIMVIPSIFEGLSVTTIESQIAGVPVIVSEAIPEEAEISNGCVRLSLDSKEWVKTIIDFSSKKVSLDDRSNDYNIKNASLTLEKKYYELLTGKKIKLYGG